MRANHCRIPDELAHSHCKEAVILICSRVLASFSLVRLIRTFRSASWSHHVLTFMSLVICKCTEVARVNFRVHGFDWYLEVEFSNGFQVKAQWLRLFPKMAFAL